MEVYSCFSRDYCSGCAAGLHHHSRCPALNQQIRQKIASYPTGTTLVTEWIETTYTHPGEKVLSGYCLDKEGNELPTEDIGYGALKYPKILRDLTDADICHDHSCGDPTYVYLPVREEKILQKSVIIDD